MLQRPPSLQLQRLRLQRPLIQSQQRLLRRLQQLQPVCSNFISFSKPNIRKMPTFGHLLIPLLYSEICIIVYFNIIS